VNETEKHKKVIVLGAGITGLLVAWKLACAGRHVTVIERAAEPGGLSRTYQWGDFRFDNGAHNFWTRDPEILKFYQDLLPGVFLERKHGFKLFISKKMIGFPFLGPEILFSLGGKKMVQILFSFTWARVRFFFRPEHQTDYLDEWVINRYGKALYKFYFKPYLEKIQKCDPRELSSAVGNKKIPRMSLRKIVTGVMKRVISRPPPGKSSGVSYYTKQGYGEIPGFFYRRFLSLPNTAYLSGETVQELTVEGDTVIGLKTENHQFDTADSDIISTIPLDDLCKFSNPGLTHLSTLARQLQYVSIRFLMMKVKKPVVTGSWMVFFNDERMPFYRVSEENYSVFEMTPEGYCSLIFEIPVDSIDPLANISDQELLPVILERFNIVFTLTPEDIVEYKSIYCSHANPRLIVGYQQIVDKLFEFILSTKNLYSLGRQGFFTYVNLDQCTRMALDFSEQYLLGNGNAENQRQLHRYFHDGL
jgi:protoporphyrinogen oxidase